MPPPAKKAKLGPNTRARFTFTSVHDIQQALQTARDPVSLFQAVSALRAKLSTKRDEILSPHDDRLTLARNWMESSPAAQDLFNIWGTVSDASTQACLMSLFSSLLSLFSCHLPDHSYGVAIIKSILSPQWLRKLSSYISGNHNEQILCTLGLFNIISTFGSGRERKLVFEAFPWDNKSLQKLLHMRRKGKESEGDDTLVRPDIRTSYVLLVLSMVDENTAPSIKMAFLEQRREVFTSIFKGLNQDRYIVIQRVLQVCWESIWSDPKIKRTTKMGLFNETTISHLLKLYDRTAAERPGGAHVPADIIHHFLLAMCTHPGQGICFRDRGWYPRESDDDDGVQREDIGSTRQKSAYANKIYNKMLGNILRTLKVNEDPRQQELALKITAACPELVAGYWSAASLTLEPRLSSKWIANISFAGQILSQAVPVSSFLLPGSNELYNPTPPPISVIMANLLPSVSTKALFTKGLQATSTPIVQHCTALVLCKCLRKLSEVMRALSMVETALEEDEENGQWSRQRREVEKEARRRVPEFQVIVAFSQQSLTSSSTTKQALLSESAQRLLWLYQECLPDVVAEARFEVSKLILNLAEGSLVSLSGGTGSASTRQEGQHNESSAALQSVKHLHVLRLLSGSDRFAWAGKVASSPHTYLYVLLRTFCNSCVYALRTALKKLLCHILSESVLFQEDSSEVEMWLSALPSQAMRRKEGAKSLDGTPLTDEVDAVATFLDDCAQRCLKTPYRYMDAMDAISSSSTSSIATHQFASPLLMTVVEQILAKVGGKLMTPSDALAVFSFVRRLLVMLASKQDGTGYGNLLAILDQLHRSVAGGELFPGHPSICFGIRRELSIARACLRHFKDDNSRYANEATGDMTITTYLHKIEQIITPPSDHARMTSAFELVDWLRLVDVHPSSNDISRLATVIHRFNESSLWALIDHLHPSGKHLWDSGILKLVGDSPPVDGVFGWAYFHCTRLHLQDQETRSILVRLLPSSLMHIENAIHLVTRDIAVSESCYNLTATLISLLSDVLAMARRRLSGKDVWTLKLAIIRSDTIYALCVSRDLAVEVHEAIRTFIETSFDSADAQDQTLLSSIGSHWVETMLVPLSSGRYNELKLALPWVKFADTEKLFTAVNLIQANCISTTEARNVLEDILGALQSRTQQNSTAELSAMKLLELKGVLPDSALLEDMLSTALSRQLPVGFDGQLTFKGGESLDAILSRPTSNDGGGLRSLPPSLISRLLEKESWTDSTARTIGVLLYLNPTSLQLCVSWLNKKRWTGLSVHVFALVLRVFLECTSLTGRDLSQINDDVLSVLLKRLFVDNGHHNSGSALHLECIHRIMQLSGTRRDKLVRVLEECIDTIPIMNLSFESTLLARKLLGVTDCDDLTTSVIDRTLQWAVRHLSSDVVVSMESDKVLDNLKHIVMQHKTLKPHLVEPLLTILVRHHLSDVDKLDLAVVLATKTPLKPVVVNRLLQSIIQHNQFVTTCGKRGSPSQRNQVTRLLETLFRLHPTNTCQASHIAPLFEVYRGTMSSADRRLLSIMRLFEAEKRTSLFSFFTQWSPSPATAVSNALEVVQSFDPVYMLRVCLSFPTWRRLGEDKGAQNKPSDDLMYDPLMVIALSAQMLVECPPTTTLGWVKVFRTNVISLLIRCLSSKDPNIRETALCQIASISESLQKSDMHEAPQVLYVFRLLKNAIRPPESPDEPPRRLPTFTTLILLHALRGIFYPSNFIYPRTARFLLQRPELDISDVPMLFGMLYSSSDEWKKERGWILKMLGDGMASTEDWKVLRRRHTWDLVASLFQSSKRDAAVRAGILEILANLTCNPQACTSLILKSSLLSWIEMQVRDGPVKESMAWLRILENILVVADTAKLSHAMGDQWCSTVCRCLPPLLQHQDKEIVILHQTAVVILRLSIVPGVPNRSLCTAVAAAMECLRSLEPGIQLHQFPHTVDRNGREIPVHPLPPHHAQGLHDVRATEDSLWTWGRIVEALWRTCMTLDEPTHVWVMLTRRLLVWRALVGEDGSQVGEWARREVTCSTLLCDG